MIWLASFPRSGNTFFRNVMYEVYGLTSSSYPFENTEASDEDYTKYPFVKTHFLPGDLPPKDLQAKSIYLVRDGRDSLVSAAHQRKDRIELHSDFYINLLHVIIAPGNSVFGGWSRNVKEWTEKADVVIKFEDLIKDPIGQTERLRAIMDLPQPKVEKLPSFEQLKESLPHYGGGRYSSLDEASLRKIVKKHFRKGKVDNWKEEMPKDLQELFWDIHGSTMEAFGYQKGIHDTQIPQPMKVLLDATVLQESGNMGIKRYLQILINDLSILAHKMPHKWEIDLLFGEKKIIPLKHYVRGKHLLSNKQAAPAPKELKGGNPFSKFHHWVHRSILLRLKVSRYRSAVSISLPDEGSSLPYDVLHIPTAQRALKIPGLARKTVVTAHDLSHKLLPESGQQDGGEEIDRGIQDAIKSNAHFISFSQKNKQDLIEYYQLSPAQSTVIYESTSAPYFHPRKEQEPWDQIKQKYQVPGTRFFLCHSKPATQKDVLTTIHAFLQLEATHPNTEISLLICGNSDSLLKANLSKHKRIYFTGPIDPQDLPFFYTHTEALCYISHHDGFGLTALEAISCGTPVIYSRNSSASEVIGDAGIGIDFRLENEILEQLTKIHQDKPYRDLLSEKALKRSFTFSSKKIAFETLKVYQKLITS